MIKNLQNHKLRAAIYLRVSTDEQIKGYGLTVQKEKLKSFVDSQDYILQENHIYEEEGFSGTLPIETRPQLKRLFENAKNKEFDVILVYRLDRFFRKTRLLLEAIELLGNCGVGFRSITEAFDTTNSTGKFMTTLLGAVAEMERDTIRERTIGGRISAAKAGKWVTGLPPYGYKLNKATKKLSVIEEEAVIVRKMFEMLVYKKNNLREIESYMNKSGIPSPKHTTIKKRKTYNYWYKRTIGRIMTNEIYTGRAYFRKYLRPFNNLTSLLDDNLKRPKEDWIEISVPPIVSEEIFQKAKEQLTRNRENAKRNMKREYLYSKITYCGYCGFRLSSGFQPPRKGRGGDGTKYYHGVYRKEGAVGTTKRCLKCPQYAESRLEPVWNCLKEILQNPKNILGPLEKYTFKDESKESVRGKIKLAEKRLGAIESKKIKLVRVYVDTDLGENEYKKQLSEYKNEEGEIKTELVKLNQFFISNKEKVDRQKVLGELYEKIKNRLDNSSYDDKKYILGLFVEKITIYSRSNYAEIVFRFRNNDQEKAEVPLIVKIKTLSENEIRVQILKANPLMYCPRILT